nr:hypothetical protein [Tanacetum cinerariifolium]
MMVIVKQYLEKERKNERTIDDRSHVHEVFDEMLKIKKPRQKGSVKEYYDLFNSFVVGMCLDELHVVSFFIWGLKPEVKKGVSLFKMKNLLEANCLANLLVENGIVEIVLGEDKDKEAGKEHDKNSPIKCFEGIDGQWAEVISGGYDTPQTEVGSMEKLGENGVKERRNKGLAMDREENNTCKMIFDKPNKDRNCLRALDMPLELSSSLDIHKDCDNKSPKCDEAKSSIIAKIVESGDPKAMGNGININMFIRAQVKFDYFKRNKTSSSKLKTTNSKNEELVIETLSFAVDLLPLLLESGRLSRVNPFVG